jgi:hypothetical protein
MVLCGWTLLPERGSPELVAGFGVVPEALVLPHYSGGRRWLDAVSGELPDGVVVLGLPECSGVVVERDGAAPTSLTAVGAEASHLLGARDRRLDLGMRTEL